MAQHLVEYTYMIPEWGAIDAMEIDEFLDYEEKEAIAIAEIKELFDDIEDIKITKIKVL